MEKYKKFESGSYLFYKNERIFHCSNYFSYLPNEKYITYKKCVLQLSNQIEKMIKNIIKKVLL